MKNCILIECFVEVCLLNACSNRCLLTKSFSSLIYLELTVSPAQIPNPNPSYTHARTHTHSNPSSRSAPFLLPSAWNGSKRLTALWYTWLFMNPRVRPRSAPVLWSVLKAALEPRWPAPKPRRGLWRFPSARGSGPAPWMWAGRLPQPSAQRTCRGPGGLQGWMRDCEAL